MPTNPYLHVGIKPTVVCVGRYCKLKHDCNRHKFYHNAAKHKLLEVAEYLSGIPTSCDGKQYHFKERVV